MSSASANETERSALAELRARTALREAGFEPSVALERASSVTNEVWLTPTHVVRINRAHSNRLGREARIAAALPSEVGYPTIVSQGGRHGEDWLITERVPGVPLAHCWPDLSSSERRTAVASLACRLMALHATRAPADLGELSGAPQLLAVGAVDPTAPLLDALERAAALEHVEPMLVHELIDLVRRTSRALMPFNATTLVHGDLTFENVLWHDGEVTALLDFEWARPGPRDLDLDVLLRCCAYPQLHVGVAHEERTRPEDYAEVPRWLAEDYPSLFAFPGQIDRLRLYSIAYNVRELLAFPPRAPAEQLPPMHAHHRLEMVLRHRSHLDALGGGAA